MEEGRPQPCHHEVPSFSATNSVFSLYDHWCCIGTAELWCGDGMGAAGRAHLGAVGARSSLDSQCTAAHPTTNTHALKEKPPNPTWLPWGHEGDVA